VNEFSKIVRFWKISRIIDAETVPPPIVIEYGEETEDA